MQLRITDNPDCRTIHFDLGESFELDNRLVITQEPINKAARCNECVFKGFDCSDIACWAIDRNDNKDVIFVTDTNSVNAGNEQTEVVAQKKEVPFY